MAAVKLKKVCSPVVINTTVYCKQRMACSNDGLIPVIVKLLKEAVLRGVPSTGHRNKPRFYSQVYTRRRIVLEQWFLICGSRNRGTERVCV
jgi:hypothetical protein